ncbi:F-box domain-containing protein [Mycena chlorophos]|uniref:F-box domain-containing protein n=1 Tax=Mycena chlorophos TaxID=658473 RepID=A0A8H6TSG6_MYCCL|nr:F-box domain-containing protein [Mycena chlorophos]
MTLSTLPFDLSEHVLSCIDARRDLISLALTCKYWTERIIPLHSQYRVIRLFNNASAARVWTHLAQRRDLAKNVRELVLREPDYPARRRARVKPERYPGGLEPAQETADKEAVVADLCQALCNMSEGLLSFTWVDPWSLMLFLGDLPDPAHSLEYPLWNIRNLRKLSLRQTSWYEDGVLQLLAKSPGLERLQLHAPTAPAIFESARLPHLRCLKINSLGTFGPAGELAAATFIERHPTIEELSWYPVDSNLRLQFGSLPRLKKLITGRAFASSLLSDSRNSRAFECLSQLTMDKATLDLLSTLDTSQLRDMRIWKFAGIESLHRLAEIAPHITLLEMPTLGMQTVEDTNNGLTLARNLISLTRPCLCFTQDDYIAVLSKFPMLEYITQSSIWPRVLNEKKLDLLAAQCPRLQRLNYYKFSIQADVDIWLLRVDGKVDWREEIIYGSEWTLV